MRRRDYDDLQVDNGQKRAQEAYSAPAPQSAAAAATLIAALVQYLGPARDKSECRRAINIWRHDVVNAGLQPEQLLVEFKKILRGLTPPNGSVALYDWESDRRDVIAMCIEEYYR